MVEQISDDSAWHDNRHDLTKSGQKWTLRCVTDTTLSIDSMPGDDQIKREYQRYRDFNTKQGQCEELSLDQPDGVPLPAGTVPGEVHEQLKELGVFQHDLLYQFEHVNQRWVHLQDWSYETMFTLTNEDLNDKALTLKLDRVGTFADVLING